MTVATTERLTGLPAEQAIPKLVNAYGDRLYTLGRRFCGNHHDAEELVQEVFFQAFRAWDSFEGRSSPATWLHTIAARVCQRRKRKRSGEPEAVLSLSELLPSPTGAVPDLPSGGIDQLDAQIRSESIQRVEAAMQAVPVKFRLPLVLKEIGDFSIDETAAVLGLKPQTVKTRVHRGRLYLRKALAEGLPTTAAEPPDHARGACMDLLRLKQDALDRDVPFPLPDAELCSRCRALFDTLELSRNLCMDLRSGKMPDKLKAMLEARFADH